MSHRSGKTILSLKQLAINSKQKFLALDYNQSVMMFALFITLCVQYLDLVGAKNITMKWRQAFLVLGPTFLERV